MAPMGSTIPLSEPMANDFHLLYPSASIGIDMIAPSGIFCIAIPIERATAPARERSAVWVSTPAITAPTAIPSGRLCNVTASVSILVRDNLLCGPSGFLLSRCR